ncbi:hypothetical protein Lalb_Chr12g0206481 [Lupinus albus]|uniref:Uncharacterized protein n=1 Tax=Lupinus albus TaxID=3870 RepID=A0A6A4PNR5_LUPAL|nr:hypothetical protein Lalb_Chr12g0206481 [Lupinus albus]
MKTHTIMCRFRKYKHIKEYKDYEAQWLNPDLRVPANNIYNGLGLGPCFRSVGN